MSSRAFNIADHMKNLQGTRTLASGAKIVGADADSIQAPGLITSAGGGDNTSLNTGLASATFPAGMMLQIVDNPITSVITRGSGNSFGAFSTPFNVTISNCQSTSKILVSCHVTHSCTGDNIAMFALYDNTNSQYVSGNNSDGHFGSSVDSAGRVRSSSFQVLYDPPSFSSGSLQIELYLKGSGGSLTHKLNVRGDGDAYGRGTSNIILQEIAG